VSRVWCGVQDRTRAWGRNEERGLAGQIRDVAVEDLLGRKPVRLEQDQIRATLKARWLWSPARPAPSAPNFAGR